MHTGFGVLLIADESHASFCNHLRHFEARWLILTSANKVVHFFFATIDNLISDVSTLILPINLRDFLSFCTTF